MSYRTVAKIEQNNLVGNLRKAVSQNGKSYKFIGNRPLDLQEMVKLIQEYSNEPVVLNEALVSYESKRSGYKFKTLVKV